MSNSSSLLEFNNSTRLEKIILNIDIGSSNYRLFSSAKLLKKLTFQFPSFGQVKKTIRSFGIRKGDYISCYCTIRGKRALLILFKGLRDKNFTLKNKNFSDLYHFGFGLSDHLNMGVEYDQSIGVQGINFTIKLDKLGSRIQFKKRMKRKIGFTKLVNKEQIIEWYK
uniref:Ribosomal protein L11 n=1 Tax=Amorphochlora amoebiformis TaxID=1561963 RepID=A0A0H5BLL0_9EUKA|nr:ribosomal protein L11 [Amorphochlora amoebiformis]